MQKLIWTNANGDVVDLTSTPYGITNWEGFSNAPINIQSQQVPFQDGGVFLDALIEQRELTVTLAIQDNNDLEKRYQYRRELIHILNPKLGEGYLIYKNDFTSKRIKCVPQIPLFETHNSNDSGTPKASLSWTACEPYWEDLEETEIILDNLSYFTLRNEGDIKSQLKINAYGNFSDFEIKNSTTKQGIKVNGEIQNGLSINTNIGNKSVESYTGEYKLQIDANEINCSLYSNILNSLIFAGNNNTCYKVSIQNDIVSISIKENANILKIIEVDNIAYICTETEILKTTNYQNFTTIYSGTGFKGIIYDEFRELFIIYGTSIITSADSENWETVYETNYQIISLDCAENVIIGITNSRYIYSTDGEEWQINNLNYSESGATSITCIENMFYITSVYSRYYKYWLSNNNTILSTRVNTPTINANGVYYSESIGKPVEVGNDGKYFIMENDSTEVLQIEGLENINLKSGIYVEEYGFDFIYGKKAIVKTNGITFGILSKSITDTIRGYYNINGKKVISGSDGIYVSISDDDKWNKVFDHTGTLIYSTYWKRFILVDKQGFYTSIDGINWIIVSTFEGGNVYPKVAVSEKSGWIWILFNESNLSPIYVTSDCGQTLQGKSQPSLRYYKNVNYISEKNQFLFSGSAGYVDVVQDESLTFNNFLNIGNLNVAFYESAYSKSLDLYMLVSQGTINFITIKDKNGFSDVPTTYFDMSNYPVGVFWNDEQGCFIIYTNTNEVYRSFDGKNIEYYFTVKNGTILFFNKDVITGTNGFLLTFVKYEINQIEKLSKNSDMNFALDIGNNNISVFFGTGFLTCKISFRQKYIGV